MSPCLTLTMSVVCGLLLQIALRAEVLLCQETRWVISVCFVLFLLCFAPPMTERYSLLGFFSFKFQFTLQNDLLFGSHIIFAKTKPAYIFNRNNRVAFVYALSLLP